MLGIVATLKVKPGMEAEFEAHWKTEHMRTLGRKMGDFMEGRAELMRLREVRA